VNKLANALLACGLVKGDKFATVLPNCTQLMAAYWAAAKTGLVIVPSSTMLNEGGLATLLKNSDTALVIADASFADVLDALRPDLPAIATIATCWWGRTNGARDSAATTNSWVRPLSEQTRPTCPSTTTTCTTSCIPPAPPARPRGSSTPTTCGPCTAPSLPPAGA
jgi:acyl-coenzyme A synthetase/AMP-(fatty) acid ligase